MKRLTWTAAMAAVGLLIGWNGQGIRLGSTEVALSTIWAGGIGYGLGTIFGKRAIGHGLLILSWAVTLALACAFFSPFVPFEPFPLQFAIAGGLGAVL